jgi:hypothetical protein
MRVRGVCGERAFCLNAAARAGRLCAHPTQPAMRCSGRGARHHNAQWWGGRGGGGGRGTANGAAALPSEERPGVCYFCCEAWACVDQR